MDTVVEVGVELAVGAGGVAVAVGVSVAVAAAVFVTVDAADEVAAGVDVASGAGVGVRLAVGAAAVDVAVRDVAAAVFVVVGTAEAVAVGMDVSSPAGVAVGLVVDAAVHPFAAAPTASIRQSIATCPVPRQSNRGHWSSDPRPRAMFTPFSSSSMVTCPSPLQSPMHDAALASAPIASAGRAAIPPARIASRATPHRWTPLPIRAGTNRFPSVQIVMTSPPCEDDCTVRALHRRRNEGENTVRSW
jgi:hypothetical protein